MFAFPRLKKQLVGIVVEKHVRAITTRYIEMLSVIADRLPILARVTAETAQDHEEDLKKIFELAEPILKDIASKLEECKDEFKGQDAELTKLSKAMSKDIEKLFKVFTS